MRAGAASTLALAGVVALAAALRFAGLGEQSYWYDEAVTVTVIDGSLGDVLDRVPDSESTPPLYYVLAWLWSQVLGLGEAGLRSLSAVAGVATVPLAYLAARAAGGPVAGLLAAAFVAVNPMLVWYSQEARAYSLVALLAAASALALVRALDRATPRRLALWSVVSTLLLLTHYFGVFVVAAEAALLLAAHRRREVLLACAPWVVAGLALLPLARAQERDGRTSWIADEPLGDRVADVARELATANSELISSNSAAPGRIAWLVAAVAVLVAVGFVVRGVIARRGAESPDGEPERGTRDGAAVRARGFAPAAALAIAGAASLLVPLLLAFTPLDFFKDRNLIAAWPVLAIALGGALALAAPRVVALAVAVAVAVGGVVACVAVATDDDLQRADWEAAVERVGPDDTPRAVLVQPAYAQAPLDVYGLELAAPAPGVGIEELIVVGTEANPRAAAPAVGAFRVVERASKGGVGFVRYRAPTLQRLDARAIREAGGGLRYAPSAAARAWTQRAASLAAGWQELLAESEPSPAAARAPDHVRELLPVPRELPGPDGLARRLTRAAQALARYADTPTAERRAAAQRALAEVGRAASSTSRARARAPGDRGPSPARRGRR